MENWKRFPRKRSWPNFKVLSRNSPGGTEKIFENLSQDSQSRGWDLNPGRPVRSRSVNHSTTTFGAPSQKEKFYPCRGTGPALAASCFITLFRLGKTDACLQSMNREHNSLGGMVERRETKGYPRLQSITSCFASSHCSVNDRLVPWCHTPGSGPWTLSG
jgi:hypothetical protein